MVRKMVSQMSLWLNRLSFRSRGVLIFVASRVRRLISPITVVSPVAVTTALPLPLEIIVPLNNMFDLSARTVDSSRGKLFLSTWLLSPVRAASLVARLCSSSRRASAGTTSPALRRITSPGTKNARLRCFSCPSLNTFAKVSTSF